MNSLGILLKTFWSDNLIILSLGCYNGTLNISCRQHAFIIDLSDLNLIVKMTNFVFEFFFFALPSLSDLLLSLCEIADARSKWMYEYALFYFFHFRKRHSTAGIFGLSIGAQIICNAIETLKVSMASQKRLPRKSAIRWNLNCV